MKNLIKINLIFVCIILLQASSCRKDDEKLRLERKNYIGNELRIDGYYYTMLDDGRIRRSFFLYKNGIYYEGSSTDSHYEQAFIDLETSFINEAQYVDNPKAHRNRFKAGWGVFVVNDSIIEINAWGYPKDAFHGAPVNISYGKILNDTAIEFLYTNANGAFIYHFKQFSPKPDSTNNFIK